MPLFNRSQLHNLALKEDVDSLCTDICQMFAESEERIVARLESTFYRAFFALALFLLVLYGATVGLMIAFFG